MLDKPELRGVGEGNFLMKKWLTVLALFLAPACFGQSWTGVLPTSRAINWNAAGLPATIKYGTGGSACNGSSANCVETISGVFTTPTRTQSGSTIASGAAESTIQTAMNSCLPGGYINLTSGGTYSFTTAFTLVNGCTLNLNGATINVTGSGTFIDMGTSGGGGSCPLTSASANYTSGTTTFICTTASPPSVGYIVALNQCNSGLSGSPCTGAQTDNAGLWDCVLSSSCNQSGGTPNSGTNQSRQQNFIVTSVNANGSGGCAGGAGTYCIGVSTGLYLSDWAFARSPTLNWQSGIQQGMGIKGGTIYFQYNQSEEIQIYQCNGCFLEGTRVIGAVLNRQVHLAGTTKNVLIYNNYFQNIDPNPSNFFASGSSTCLQWGQDSDSLVLNNIHVGCIFENYGASEGDVLAYNFLRDSQTSYYQNSQFNHADEYSGSALNLTEGEEAGVIYDDDTWGTKYLNTYFRNYISCYDPPYQITASNGNARCYMADNYSRVMNAIGNVQGGTAAINAYTVANSETTYGYVWGFGTGADSYNGPTFYRWGNVSRITQSSDSPTANSGVRFNSSEVPTSLSGNFAAYSVSVPSNDNLPCSFFLAAYTSTTCTPHANGGTGLAFWKVVKTWTTFPTAPATTGTQPFPPIGPDVTSGPYVSGYAYDIPAEVAWSNLPVDSTYQHTYTVTASSWSASCTGIASTTYACETLTVTGLPSSNLHVQGAFQVSGMNSACTTGATFGNSSELLMTSSSTTTISYALTSNPGVSCTGSFLFPDVRQFDERVYEADNASQASNPSCSPTSGAVPQTVTCTNPNSGTTIMCYAASPTNPATNGAGTACSTGTQYTTSLSISSPETLNVIAGTSTLSDSSIVSYTYTAGQATAATCSPTSGTVPQTVTCTNPNSGTTVACYTTNGSTPATNGAGTGCTTGTQYTTSIAVSVPETIMIIAGTSTLTDSSVNSYTYTAASIPAPCPQCFAGIFRLEGVVPIL